VLSLLFLILAPGKGLRVLVVVHIGGTNYIEE
jgi:hypothetical protein